MSQKITRKDEIEKIIKQTRAQALSDVLEVKPGEKGLKISKDLHTSLFEEGFNEALSQWTDEINKLK
jgi:hypothetical protein